MSRNTPPITVPETDMTETRARRPATAARWAGMFVLLAMLAQAGVALREEIVVVQASACLERVNAGESVAACPLRADLPPRAALAVAHADLAQASRSSGDMRDLWLQRAAPQLALARQRPQWGDLDVAEAYYHQLAKGPLDPGTVSAYARSYRDAPYLHDAVLWRIRLGAFVWDALPPATQNAMLDEAGSYAQGGTGPRALIGLILHGSAAETAYARHQSAPR